MWKEGRKRRKGEGAGERFIQNVCVCGFLCLRLSLSVCVCVCDCAWCVRDSPLTRERTAKAVSAAPARAATRHMGGTLEAQAALCAHCRRGK